MRSAIRSSSVYSRSCGAPARLRGAAQGEAAGGGRRPGRRHDRGEGAGIEWKRLSSGRSGLTVPMMSSRARLRPSRARFTATAHASMSDGVPPASTAAGAAAPPRRPPAPPTAPTTGAPARPTATTASGPAVAGGGLPVPRHDQPDGARLRLREGVLGDGQQLQRVRLPRVQQVLPGRGSTRRRARTRCRRATTCT